MTGQVLRRFADRIGSGEFRVVPKTIEIPCKVMFYTGLHKIPNLCQAIPECEYFKSNIVKLDGISYRDRRAVLNDGKARSCKKYG